MKPGKKKKRVSSITHVKEILKCKRSSIDKNVFLLLSINHLREASIS